MSFRYHNQSLQPLVPALKSNWLLAHVITCFVGYAAFGIAFGLSIMYLLKRLENPNNESLFFKLIPRSAILDELSYQMIAIGFILLTLGIITGAVWAHSAWGRYWGWDPKENGALLIILWSAILFHAMIDGTSQADSPISRDVSP